MSSSPKLFFQVLCVIYWLSTKLSIKWCTCVNKRKNSRSRWVLNNNIIRCTDSSSHLETRCRSKSQRQKEGFRPSVTHSWATPAKMRKKCCFGHKKNLGQYSSLSLSPTHLSHITNITLSRIKCERYIFIKNCIRSFIEVHILCLIMSLLIFVSWLYNIWDYCKGSVYVWYHNYFYIPKSSQFSSKVLVFIQFFTFLKESEKLRSTGTAKSTSWQIYVVHSISFQPFLYRHLKLS